MKMGTRTVAEPSYRRSLGHQAILLGSFACLVSAILMMGNHGTAPDIAERLDEDRRALLTQVLPAQLYDNNPLEDSTRFADSPFAGDSPVFLAARDGHFTGAALEVVGKGYSGDIVLLLGVAASGEILGVRVISHAETPGLGDKIELSRDDWILSFDGLSLKNTAAGQWAVKKDGGRFDQFTGATITPRAVVRAVHQGLEVVDTHREQLAADLPLPAEESTP